MLSSPRGASPGAAGVRIASYSLNTSSSAALSGGTRRQRRRCIRSPDTARPRSISSRSGSLSWSPPLLVVAMEIVRHLDFHDDLAAADRAAEALAQIDSRPRPRRAPRRARRTPRCVAGSACSQAGERTKAKRGGSGGSRARGRQQRRARDRPGVGSSASKPAITSRQQRRVLDRAREHADMIERAREQQRAGARNQAVASA